MIELPIEPSIPLQRFGCAIEQRPYVFDLRWNGREGYWYMDVREIDLTLIIAGVKIVLGAKLGRESEHVLFAEGILIAVDLNSTGQSDAVEAKLEDLGKRVVLRYMTALEFIQRWDRAIAVRVE